MLNHRINTLRLAFGWSQVELAKRICVSKQAVSNWENDNIQPSIEMLIRLADTFGVTTDFLLCREDIPQLNLDGITPSARAHLALLAQDLRQAAGEMPKEDTPESCNLPKERL